MERHGSAVKLCSRRKIEIGHVPGLALGKKKKKKIISFVLNNLLNNLAPHFLSVAYFHRQNHKKDGWFSDIKFNHLLVIDSSQFQH